LNELDFEEKEMNWLEQGLRIAIEKEFAEGYYNQGILVEITDNKINQFITLAINYLNKINSNAPFEFTPLNTTHNVNWLGLRRLNNPHRNNKFFQSLRQQFATKGFLSVKQWNCTKGK